MTMMRRCLVVALVAAYSCVSAFVPTVQQHFVVEKPATIAPNRLQAPKFDLHETAADTNHHRLLSAALPASLVLFSSLPAHAAGDSGFVLASAVVAYIHYASLLVCAGVLVTERLLVSPDMSFDEEELLWKADALYGIAGLTLFISGYYRVVEYGKGWEFYAHEPLFWLKLVLVGVWGASSFFPTITIVKRVVEQRETGNYPPLSQKLADRMISIINAELLAIASIPLLATTMSRGVLYFDGQFPWQVGAGLVTLTFGGFGFKYAKEALTWSEDEDMPAVSD